MSGGSTILELRSATAGIHSSDAEDARAEAAATARDDSPPEEIEAIDEAPPPHDWTRALWVAALLAALGWIGTMLWLSWPSLAAASPVALAGFIAALCVPPALIGILLLLTLRTSTAEARRFGITAHAMRAEAAALERTVAVLSGVIDANRDKLADQTTALMAMGDGVADRLRSVGTGMAAEVRAADANARQLTDATDAAHAKLTLLLGLLPRARDETSEIAGLLERTGITASESAAALDAQIVALAERGREADAVAGGAAQRLAAHITRMEVTSETAGARLESVTGAMSEAVDGLLGRTAEAVDEARKGIAAQGDAMLAMLGTNQAALDRAAHDSAVALAERISAIEAVVDRIAARLDAQREIGDSVVRELDSGFVRVAGQLDALHVQGVDRTQSLAASISALGGSADAMTEALRAGDAIASTAISTTDRLLTALDAAAREIDETLPEALARLDSRIGDSRRVVSAAKPELLALVTAAESTHDAIAAIAQVVAAQRTTLDELSQALLDTLTNGQAKADALGHMVEETIGTTNRLAEEAAPRLVEMLLRVRDTATTAAERARETLATVVPDAAQALESASLAAMERASAASVERQIVSIGRAADAAAAAAGSVAERLAGQLAALAAQTAAVESRIAEANAEREAAEQDSFARRVSLLIDSLNSASIDIAKAFSTEVTDSAWGAYLKGDRGVFTRRAVRLLDANEAREIARLYDDEAGFREQVNRYIHDFEAMLRAILAQRDGSPLGVTMLSSDMGKLYVALAQAIERLRT